MSKIVLKEYLKEYPNAFFDATSQKYFKIIDADFNCSANDDNIYEVKLQEISKTKYNLLRVTNGVGRFVDDHKLTLSFIAGFMVGTYELNKSARSKDTD